MPAPGIPLRKLGFLTIGLFDRDDPAAGLNSTLRIIEQAESLGFDSVYLRHRHLQYGISSPLTMLAAAAQRTNRIELGTAVMPLGWENPLRLAEDLATVDLLSGGRLNPGISVGPPMKWDQIKQVLYPESADVQDFSYERVERLLRFVAGERAWDFSGREGVVEEWSERVEPHSPGLRSRMWYGGGSTRSATWAGQHGLNFLSSSVIDAEDERGFDAVQAAQLQTFKSLHPSGRCSQGLVVIPTDSATPAQQEKYAAYVAARTPRTLTPQPAGPRHFWFAADIVGTSEQIAEQLYALAAFREVDEVVFALPFSFAEPDYEQIISDLATHLGPALGWRRAA
jgi:alkanesulfonate monooxygenase SsuD/methylene tetrahydromethanopterin reductase-like flavin-dependent oxidoreductase (luciferase family)